MEAIDNASAEKEPRIGCMLRILGCIRFNFGQISDSVSTDLQRTVRKGDLMGPALGSSKRASIVAAGLVLVVLGLAPSAQGACKTIGNVVVYDQNADTWDPDNLWDPNTAQSATNKPSFAGNVSRAVKGDGTGCVNYWLSIHALSGASPPTPAFPPFAKFNSNMKALAEFSWAKTFTGGPPSAAVALSSGIAWRTAMTTNWPTNTSS